MAERVENTTQSNDNESLTKEAGGVPEVTKGNVSEKVANAYTNRLIDGDFRINEMGGAGTALAEYIIDMWRQAAGAVSTVTPQFDSDLNKNQIDFALTSDIVQLIQRLDDVSIDEGVKLSYCVQVTSITGLVNMFFRYGQNFGSGGSSIVNTDSGAKDIPASTTDGWFRFDITVPSTGGKTIGANSYRLFTIRSTAALTGDITFTKARCIPTPEGIPDDVVPEWVKKDEDPNISFRDVRKYYPLVIGQASTLAGLGGGISADAVEFTIDVGAEVVQIPSVTFSNVNTIANITLGTQIVLSGSETITNEGFNGNSITFRLTDTGLFVTNNVYSVKLNNSTFIITPDSRF